jgi:outer membrane protein assembly factor BamB
MRTLALLLVAGCGSSSGGGGADAAPGADSGDPADAAVAGEPLDLLWTHDYVLQMEFAPALAADGTIVIQGKRATYTPEGGPTLIALDPASREVMWSAVTDPGAVPAPPPTIDDGVVIAPATVTGEELGGRLYRFDLATGQVLAPVELTGPVTDGIAIGADGTLYAPATPLQAVVESEVDWSYMMVDGGKTGSNPAIGPSGSIYVGGRGVVDHNLHAVNPDGSEKWKRDMGASIIQPIAIGPGELVHAVSADGLLVAYESDGELAWSFQLDSYSSGGGMVIGPDGTVYVGSIGNLPGSYTSPYLYAVRDGAIVWQKLVGLSWISTTPALSAAGTLYVSDFCRGLHAVRASDGEVTASYQIEGLGEDECASFGAPTIGPDGTVYVWNEGQAGGPGSGLYVFHGDGTGPADSSWPQEGADAAHTGRAR